MQKDGKGVETSGPKGMPQDALDSNGCFRVRDAHVIAYDFCDVHINANNLIRFEKELGVTSRS